MSGLAIERAWPYVIAFIFSVLWLKWLQQPFPTNANGLIGATGTVSAVLVGFLITSKAIILGLTGTAVFKALSDSNYKELLFAYIFEAEVSGLLLLVLSLCGFFVIDGKGASPFAFQLLWVAASVLAVALFGRFLYILHALLKHVG